MQLWYEWDTEGVIMLPPSIGQEKRRRGHNRPYIDPAVESSGITEDPWRQKF